MSPRPVVAIASALVALLAFAAPGELAAAPTGDGSFASRGLEMPVASAMAFRGKSTIDKADVIVVAISNGDFDVEWLSTFTDRRRAIQQRMNDKDVVYVFLEFKPDGAYRGLSYFFRSGNGCGYCGGGVASTVKLAGGKLAGTLKMKDESRTMDVKLDVPIQSDDHGPALPAGGGEPGKAYLAYHDALVKRDAKALRATMSKENGQWLDAAAKKGKAAGEMKSMAKTHPEQSVRILRGWSKGDRAVVLFEGESSMFKLAGEAVLVREGGAWKVDDELADLVMQ